MSCRLGLYSGGVLALLLVSSALASSAARGQESSGATAPVLEQALAKLQLSYTKASTSYRFALNGYDVELSSVQDGKKLLIRARLGGPVPAAKELDHYNRNVGITTQAVPYGTQSVALQAGFDCRLGVTAQALAKFITGFGQDIREYETFAGKAPPAKIPEGVGEAADPEPRGSGVKPTREKPTEPAVKGAPVPLKITPGTDDKEIAIEFPTHGGAVHETAWKIVWDMKSAQQAAEEGFKVGSGSRRVLFQIKKAYFRPGAKVGWVQVLENAHPSEFYVPYAFHNTRFFDLRDVGAYVPLGSSEGGPRSVRLGKDKSVMAELRDRGLAYKHGSISRRAEELVLWANFAAGNYTYLVEFCFHDDGTIAFKHAPTGYNYFDHFETAAHMHNCLWRIGVKLAPVSETKANNQVAVVRLPYEPNQLGSNGKLNVDPVMQESFHDFEAKEFTRLRVTNPDFSVFPMSERTESRERPPIGYDLVPSLQGIARHYRFKDEAFSLHDFWVTRSDCPEKMYINLPTYFSGAKGVRPLAGSDGVVFWHMSSALHVPRGEDGIYDGNSLTNGQALVNFTTVELRPRNMFAKTPLYKR
jgi:primary-amine oxidase